MFCLLDDKGAIHIPKPYLGEGGGTDDLDFKLFYEQVGNEEASGGTHGCTMDLFKILAPLEEVGIFKEELQQGDYLWD